MLDVCLVLATDGLCAKPQTRAGVFHPPERKVQRKEPTLLHHIHSVKESNFTYIRQSHPGIMLEYKLAEAISNPQDKQMNFMHTYGVYALFCRHIIFQ